MEQDKIVELENELEKQRKERETYSGDSVKELINLYEKENKILEKIIEAYRINLKEKIEELKILNSKRV